jgi:hypothetical protein
LEADQIQQVLAEVQIDKAAIKMRSSNP